MIPLQPGESYTVDNVRYADFEAYHLPSLEKVISENSSNLILNILFQ